MTAEGILLPVMSAWAWPLSWAVVAAASVVWLWPREAHHLPAHAVQPMVATPPSRAHRKVKGPAWLMGLTAACLALLAVWPNGGWSGFAALALQSPSLLTLTWAIVCLWRATGRAYPPRDHTRVPASAWFLLCALGWLLTIDTLNLWPWAWDVSVYAWGFSAGGLWLCALVVGILAWLRPGLWAWPGIAVLGLYVCLRWPSGNVWDAWLDPAVWLAAHVQVARQVWPWVRVGRQT